MLRALAEHQVSGASAHPCSVRCFATHDPGPRVTTLPQALSGGYSNTPGPLIACGRFRPESRTLPHGSWSAAFPPGVSEPLTPESGQCGPRSPVIHGHWQSWSLRDDLDNASMVSLAGDLPVGQRGLLVIEHRQAS